MKNAEELPIPPEGPASGRRLEAFSEKAGLIRGAFASADRGVRLVRISSVGFSETIRLIRPRD